MWAELTGPPRQSCSWMAASAWRHTASSSPSDHVARCCLPARVHPLCCYPVNSAQPSDLSSVFASVPTAVAMKCQLQSSLTQGHKYYFHRSAIKGLWLLHWAPARVSQGQQRRLPPTGLLPLPVGLLPEQTNTGCREERPLTRESDMTSLLATCIESPLHRATI